MATSCNKIGKILILIEKCKIKCHKSQLFILYLSNGHNLNVLWNKKPYPFKIKYSSFLLHILYEYLPDSQTPHAWHENYFLFVIRLFTVLIFREPFITLGHKLFQYLLFEPETQWNTSCPVLRRPQQFSQTLLLAVSSWQLHFHEFSQWLQYKGHKNFNFSFFLTTTSNFRKSLNKI